MEDEKMIIELFNKYIRFWNNHDIKNWGMLFTDNTEFITWSGIKYHSNSENVKEHSKAHQLLSDHDQNMTYNLNIQNVSFIRKDIAIVYAAWNWENFKTTNFYTESRTGILMMLLLKENGSWLIRYTQNTRTDKRTS